MKKINWYRCEEKLPENAQEILLSEINTNPPAQYYELLANCDAGVPIETDFVYFDTYFQENISQALGCFLGISNQEYNIIKINKSPPEFFPEGLVAFAETGNGDFICFDYRNGKDNRNPPIVYWNHEADIGKDVSFIANNFEEFIDMLEEPQDL